MTTIDEEDQRLTLLSPTHDGCFRYVHARSAASGDRSLQAAVAATKKVAEEVADDHLVFLLSDANLGRYVDGDVLIVVYCWLCFIFLVY